MAADQQFCLRWNNHQSTLISVFDTLLASEQLVDCTLAAEGQYLKAHKVVLSACSPYLELLLAQHYEKHPIVILKDVKFQELKSMMDYMYRGEVNISQDQLATFLKAAESLQIKGLTDSGEDSRDVGSTKRVDGAAQGARKPVASSSASAAGASQQPPRSPAVLNPSSSSGLTIEPRHSSPHRSRDGSMSPTPRKRRRARRPSQGDDNQMSDSHIDTSNSCDLPSQPQSAVSVPTALSSTVAASLSKSLDSEHLETDQLLNSRLQNSNMDAVLIKEKVEPTSELMIEPKTEYMDENNEDSVEDLTLDDDDDMDMNRSGMDMGRPGPSHGDSNQGFATSWHMQGDRSGTDEVFMAAQEAVGAQRDSQVTITMPDYMPSYWYQQQAMMQEADRCKLVGLGRRRRHISMVEQKWQCPDCSKCYIYERGLNLHRRFECGKEPMFKCPFCPKKCHQLGNLTVHIKSKHIDVFRTTQTVQHPFSCSRHKHGKVLSVYQA